MVNPVLKEGQHAPAFTLPAHEGAPVRLTRLKGRWIVLYFCLRDMTPGCTTEACDFRDAWLALQARGVSVLGVSPGQMESLRRFAALNRLPFPLLHDKDSKVASKYGAWREKSTRGQQDPGMVRSTFVIDPSGRIARVFDNIRVKGHVSHVLRWLQAEQDGNA